jgi:hypothetical protein
VLQKLAVWLLSITLAGLAFAAAIYFVVRRRAVTRRAWFGPNIVDLNFPKQDRHEHENTPLGPADINVALPIIKEFFKNRLHL